MFIQTIFYKKIKRAKTLKISIKGTLITQIFIYLIIYLHVKCAVVAMNKRTPNAIKPKQIVPFEK